MPIDQPSNKFTPSTVVDRSWNVSGISYRDFKQICVLAETNTTIRDVLDELKVVHILLDSGRDLDQDAYPGFE